MRIGIDLLIRPAVRTAGQHVPVGSPMRCAVLAALALRCPDEVSVDELITMLWDDRPPLNAAGNVHTHIGALRRLFAERLRQQDVLVSSGTGYRLVLSPDAVDAQRFGARVRAGYRLVAEGSYRAAVAEFDNGLALCAGEPLGDVPGPYAAAQRRHLTQRRLDALEAWSGALIRLGEHERTIEPLTAETARYPLREHLVTNLVEALADHGRGTEALDLCERTENRLVNDLGVRPGGELAALHSRLLGRSSTIAAAESPSTVTSGPRHHTVPAQLPPDIPVFAGRGKELHRLRNLLDADPAHSTGVVLLHGEAGAGKTALATRFGWERASRFPDGQLYVNLRPSGAGGEPVSAGEALGILLRSLGVTADDIPPLREQRAGYLRTLLSGRRTCLVLDNASDTRQVLPLLPGAEKCFVMVTSRYRLQALSVVADALAIETGPLSEQEARRLLGEIVGTDRIDAEPEAVQRLVRHCRLLPLQLRVAAEYAQLRSQHRLADLVTELESTQQRLDVFASYDHHRWIPAPPTRSAPPRQEPTRTPTTTRSGRDQPPK